VYTVDSAPYGIDVILRNRHADPDWPVRAEVGHRVAIGVCEHDVRRGASDGEENTLRQLDIGFLDVNTGPDAVYGATWDLDSNSAGRGERCSASGCNNRALGGRE
jgi:hypothetical protein